MFNDLDGTMFDKQQIVLPIIDEEFSLVDTEMTDYQFHFIRDVTLHSKYPKSRVDFTPKDLKWLINKFNNKPTQQRATMICALLDVEELSEQKKKVIKHLLKGTIAESL